jgi:hypothetical protein
MARKSTAQAAAERSQLALIIAELRSIGERIDALEKDQRRMAYLIWKDDLAAMAETTDRPGD